MKSVIRSNGFIIILFIIISIVVIQELMKKTDATRIPVTEEPADSTWKAPSLFSDNITSGKEREMIIYGEALVTNTAKYLGPHGSVRSISNGMNCQNCHLDAGTRPWGNNYGAVYSTYPKLRARSNRVESITKRVNDCFQRSLNGQALDTSGYEMQSIYAYLKWLGKDVSKNRKPYSAGLPALPYLNRAADPQKGKAAYAGYCQSCHGENGEGVMNPDQTSYSFPPLWGKNSYNDGAGLFRLSRFASFIKNNMPYNQSSHANPKLSDEEAWDIAAFVNSQPRPHIDQSKDWPDITKKPADEPFGPYTDSYSANQHKYGPYQPIESEKNKMQNTKQP